MDEATASSGGQAVSLREVLVHTIEEYARHSGHGDLRERIDIRGGSVATPPPRPGRSASPEPGKPKDRRKRTIRRESVDADDPEPRACVTLSRPMPWGSSTLCAPRAELTQDLFPGRSHSERPIPRKSPGHEHPSYSAFATQMPLARRRYSVSCSKSVHNLEPPYGIEP